MAPERPTLGQTKSFRAYGRHRALKRLPGGSATAVSRAHKSGRLNRSIVYVDGSPRISDPDLADLEWAENTDHSRAPSTVKAAADGVTAAGVTVPDVTGRAVTASSDTLAEASRREKNAKADLAELEFLEKTRQVVPAKVVEDAWTDIAAQVRAAVLSVPSKAKTMMPHLKHEDLAVLNDLLCQALETLADASAADAA